METRARYVLIGLFTLVVIAAGFAFVYWIEKTGGLSERRSYKVHFQNSVAGLLPGSAVTFNGVRVGEVSKVALDPARPNGIAVIISVSPETPIRADTIVGIEFQGFTSSPAVGLTGGSANAKPLEGHNGELPELVADPNSSQTLTQSAQTVLHHIDDVVESNAAPLNKLVNNLSTFSDALARNSDKVDGIMSGIERLTGNVKAAAQIYDLNAATSFNLVKKTIPGTLVVADPTVPIALDNDKIIVNPQPSSGPLFKDSRWSDTMSKLFQSKIVQSFENANFAKEVTRPVEGVTGDFKLVVDIRALQIDTTPTPMANVTFSVKILNPDGKILAGRVFTQKAPLEGLTEPKAIAAVNAAFAKSLSELVDWTLENIGAA